MKALLRLKYLFIPACLVLINLPACREDIYDPNANGSNINEPMVLSYSNSFSFLLNANDITYYVVNYTQLSETTTQVIISVQNYQSGYVEIFVTDEQLNPLYSVKIDSNAANVSANIKNNIPERVALHFHQFTGNLKVQLNSIYYYY